MIKLTQIAEMFENGLNNLYGNPEIKFHIWSDVGKFDKPYRDGNTITRYLTGNLRSTSSANDANLLLMGTNDLSLEFAIPLKRPRTNAKQSEEELRAIQNGQYPFVEEIKNVLNGYFQEAQSVIIPDGEDKYSVSFSAGVSISGVVDIASQLGQHVTASVYVQLYFIKGGTISKDVQVTFDNVLIPYQHVDVARANVIERDVYAGKFVSKGISSSNAFSIDLNFPSNGDDTTQELIDFVLNGEPNTVHFVNVKWGNISEQLFLMTVDNVTTRAEGVTIAGISASLIEVVENAQMLSLPAGFQMGRFTFSNTTATQLTFSLSVACKAFIGGDAYEWTEGSERVTLSANDYEYDEETDKYYVYLITDRSVTLSASSATFTVVKEGIVKEAQDG